MPGPLTFTRSWTFDTVGVLFTLLLGVGYLWCHRRARISRGQSWCFGAGIAIWLVATTSAVAFYAPLLFWVRAVQVLLVLYVAPFLLILCRPVTVLQSALGEARGARWAAASSGRLARVLLSPPVTSILMLATPWLLYLTPWYVLSLTCTPVAEFTRLLLLLIGFGYFYTRLQADPVPRRYSPLLSIGISVAEGLGDGVLGLVLWLGPLIAYDYYAGLNRDFGPSLRDDQSFGAGVLWILGDVLGIPFIAMLMKALGRHERERAAEIDANLDSEEAEGGSDGHAGTPSLWWQSDPQLRDRFRR